MTAPNPQFITSDMFTQVSRPKGARTPPIQDPQQDVDSLHATVRQLKDAVEQLTRQKGLNNSAVTVGEFTDIVNTLGAQARKYTNAATLRNTLASGHHVFGVGDIFTVDVYSPYIPSNAVIADRRAWIANNLLIKIFFQYTTGGSTYFVPCGSPVNYVYAGVKEADAFNATAGQARISLISDGTHGAGLDVYYNVLAAPG